VKINIKHLDFHTHYEIGPDQLTRLETLRLTLEDSASRLEAALQSSQPKGTPNGQ